MYNVDHLELGGDNPSSNRHLPFFNLETADDQGLFVGVGWSGNWVADLDADPDTQMGSPGGEVLRTQVGMEQTEFRLHPGERVRSSRILSMIWKGERLHGHNMFRQLLSEAYVPDIGSKPQYPPVSTNPTVIAPHERPLDRRGYEQSEEAMLALIDSFTELGIEYFYLPAGWYEGSETGGHIDWTTGLGNWSVHPEKYPNGFSPLAERLYDSGVFFGLFFAPERVDERSALYQRRGDLIEERDAGDRIALRLDLPEARQYFLDRVDKLATEEGLTAYRNDLRNPYGSDASYRTGISEIEHVMGLYDLWDDLRERYPDFLMDGCCSGGRRIDLETLSRFHFHQQSDRWFDTESDQSALYGANLFLPGGLIIVFTQPVDDYGLWSRIAGLLCLGWEPTDEEFPTERAQDQVQLYKRVREYLDGDFYPLTAASLDVPWIDYQFHKRDSDAGVALLYKRSETNAVGHTPEDRFDLRLRGLESDTDYAVSFESADRTETRPGRVLTTGLEVTINETPGAEILWYIAE